MTNNHNVPLSGYVTDTTKQTNTTTSSVFLIKPTSRFSLAAYTNVPVLDIFPVICTCLSLPQTGYWHWWAGTKFMASLLWEIISQDKDEVSGWVGDVLWSQPILPVSISAFDTAGWVRATEEHLAHKNVPQLFPKVCFQAHRQQKAI